MSGRLGAASRRHPEAGRAFAAGEVGFAHTQVITRVLEDAPAQVAGEAGPALVGAARRTDPHRLGMLTRHLRHRFAPEAVLDEARHNHERRRLHISESMGGVYYLDGVLDTEGGALLRTALDAVMGPPAKDDDRTPAQRRADALTDLARRQLDSGELWSPAALVSGLIRAGAPAGVPHPTTIPAGPRTWQSR